MNKNSHIDGHFKLEELNSVDANIDVNNITFNSKPVSLNGLGTESFRSNLSSMQATLTPHISQKSN